MRLYHVGTTKIEKPNLKFGRNNADFGQGFYLSPNIDFSLKWATNGMILNVYELDLSNLKIKEFKRDEEWFNYIFNNRRNNDLLLDYDVIIGPISNDTIYDTWGILTSGLIDNKQALKCLCAGVDYTQVVIKSDKANDNLSFIRSEIINNIDIENNKKLIRIEEEKYQEEMLNILGNKIKKLLS